MIAQPIERFLALSAAAVCEAPVALIHLALRRLVSERLETNDFRVQLYHRFRHALACQREITLNFRELERLPYLLTGDVLH
jgi:hypothetical protein